MTKLEKLRKEAFEETNIVVSNKVPKYKYIGTFIADNGDKYKLTVSCNGFIQAVILLTADAIRLGKHYQLSTVEDEEGSIRQIGDILKIGEIIS